MHGILLLHRSLRQPYPIRRKRGIMLQAQHLPHFLRQPIMSIFDCVQFAGHVDHVVSLKRGVLVLTSELVLHCGLVSLVLCKRIYEGWACCILGTLR